MNLLKVLKGRGIKIRLINPIDFLMDLYLRINTFGHHSPINADGHSYEPTSYKVLDKVLAELNPQKDDVFVDLGCGLARPVLYTAYKYKLAISLGVEVNIELIKQANENLSTLRFSKSPIEIVESYAQEFNFDKVNIIFMYNPFGRDTMAKVMEIVKTSLQDNPRSLRIAYLNPIENDVLVSCSWLSNFKNLYHGEISQLNIGEGAVKECLAVSFYRTSTAYGS